MEEGEILENRTAVPEIKEQDDFADGHYVLVDSDQEIARLSV